ncbi:helix-turn-helix domain-containing protein [Desulfobacter sp.]|uniref:helix-turn-helix domain-containing protein n=1 Tax=Desulfobacter sp. TaxID=2294 RepID=UPI003D0F4F6B
MVYKSVRKELINQDLKIKDIAEATGYSPEHISGVINGRHNSPKVKKIIALVLGKDFDSLWSTESTDQTKTPA